MNKSLPASYRKMASSRWLLRGMIIFFVVQLCVNLAYVFVLVFFKGLGWENILNIGVFARVAENLENLTFVDWMELGSSGISVVFAVLGILFLRRKRLLVLRMFERAILVSIFLTQVFIFYEEQFGALFSLAIHLLILAALQFMIEKEQAIAYPSNLTTR